MSRKVLFWRLVGLLILGLFLYLGYQVFVSSGGRVEIKLPSALIIPLSAEVTPEFNLVNPIEANAELQMENSSVPITQNQCFLYWPDGKPLSVFPCTIQAGKVMTNITDFQTCQALTKNAICPKGILQPVVNDMGNGNFTVGGWDPQGNPVTLTMMLGAG
jgi:hypothetical protein